MLRPADERWDDWTDGQMDKVRCALDQMQAWAPTLVERVDIGTNTLGCALGYLDFRFPDFPWREGRDALSAYHERFDARPSMAAGRPG